MPLTMHDFECACGHTEEQLVQPDEEVRCPECNAIMQRCLGSPHIFSTIIATYPGSKKLKAGYQHQHVNQPATKTQIGYGGSVSNDNPRK